MKKLQISFAMIVVLALLTLIAVQVGAGNYVQAYYYCRGNGGIRSVEFREAHVHVVCKAGKGAEWPK